MFLTTINKLKEDKKRNESLIIIRNENLNTKNKKISGISDLSNRSHNNEYINTATKKKSNVNSKFDVNKNINKLSSFQEILNIAIKSRDAKSINKNKTDSSLTDLPKSPIDNENNYHPKNSGPKINFVRIKCKNIKNEDDKTCLSQEKNKIEKKTSKLDKNSNDINNNINDINNNINNDINNDINEESNKSTNVSSNIIKGNKLKDNETIRNNKSNKKSIKTIHKEKIKKIVENKDNVKIMVKENKNIQKETKKLASSKNSLEKEKKSDFSDDKEKKIVEKENREKKKKSKEKEVTNKNNDSLNEYKQNILSLKTKNNLIKKRYKDQTNADFFSNMFISTPSNSKKDKIDIESNNIEEVSLTPEIPEISLLRTGLTPVNNNREISTHQKSSKKKDQIKGFENYYLSPLGPYIKNEDDTSKSSSSENTIRKTIGDILIGLESTRCKGKITSKLNCEKQNKFITQLHEKLSLNNKQNYDFKDRNPLNKEINYKNSKGNKISSNHSKLNISDLKSNLDQALNKESEINKQISDDEKDQELLWNIHEDKTLQNEDKELLLQELIANQNY